MTTFRERLKTRFGVLGVVVLLALSALLVRLWVVQVLASESFAVLAESNRIREFSLEAPRGRILDRQGRELVVDRPSLAVKVDPAAIDDEDLLLKLSGVLQMPVDEIEERLRTERVERLKPRVVKYDISMDVASYLSENAERYPGVEVGTISVRSYPNGDVMAHVLGYTGEISEEQLQGDTAIEYSLGDIVGKAGAEVAFESVLQGERGYQRLEVDNFGQPRRELDRREPVSGRDVVLTLDLEVQKVAEDSLAYAMDQARKKDFRNARAGAAVVLDVKTGEVIAMASAPGYDPELFIGGIRTEDWERLNSKESEYPLNNRAVMSAYPPASTFKVVTGVAGLEEGVSSQWKQYFCAGKWTEMGEQWPKWCWKRSGHGRVTFLDGIKYSCDTVFYEIGYEFYREYRRSGAENLQAYARSFGIGEKTGIELPGEVAGRVPDAAWKREFNEYYPEYQLWLPGDTVNMAIGQGDVLTSPLQMAAIYASLGNDGLIMKPHILKEVLDADGIATRVIEPEVIHEVSVSADSLQVMRRALRSVTEDGTGAGAFRGFDVDVAGKTGTAEVKGKDDFAWFAAYAPADEPKYAVAIVIEQGGSGGSVAAPAARQILAALFDLPIEQVQATDQSR